MPAPSRLSSRRWLRYASRYMGRRRLLLVVAVPIRKWAGVRSRVSTKGRWPSLRRWDPVLVTLRLCGRTRRRRAQGQGRSRHESVAAARDERNRLRSAPNTLQVVCGLRAQPPASRHSTQHAPRCAHAGTAARPPSLTAEGKCVETWWKPTRVGPASSCADGRFLVGRGQSPASHIHISCSKSISYERVVEAAGVGLPVTANSLTIGTN
jgi:hypothetical protein